MRRMLWAVAVFAILGGLYLFLAGSVDTVEGIAMVVCAAAGTVLFAALENVAKRNFAPLPPPRAILRPLAVLLPEVALVGRELLAVVVSGPGRSLGGLAEQPFEPGGEDASARARRALTVIGVSLAPRTFVVRGERTQTLLLHGLPPKPTSVDRRWPA